MRDIAIRVAAAALAFAIVFGSLFLWIGAPVLGMWVAGQVTTSSVGFLFATLGGIPLTMIATGFAIYRMNASPQMTSAEPRMRMPAWRSASPKNRSTRPLYTSPITRAMNRAMSPNDPIVSRAQVIPSAPVAFGR